MSKSAVQLENPRLAGRRLSWSLRVLTRFRCHLLSVPPGRMHASDAWERNIVRVFEEVASEVRAKSVQAGPSRHRSPSCQRQCV